MPNTRVPAIQQRLNGNAESICIKCFHRNVCRAIDNQPCIECNQFTDANGVTVQEWIPVTERLPEKEMEVIVYTGNRLKPSVFCYHFWTADMLSWQAVTHWMPLPEPPKGE